MAIPVQATPRTVTLTIDGREVTVAEGSTIWAAAKEAGIDIPVLCHDERFDPVGVCRMCVVDVGARAYAAACVRPCEDGMEVRTATRNVERSRASLVEMLLSAEKQNLEAKERFPDLFDHRGLKVLAKSDTANLGADLSCDRTDD